MGKRKVALILGSGFSREAQLPTTKDLANCFVEFPNSSNGWNEDDSIEREITKHLKSFWERVFGYIGSGTGPSLEDHFTIIDMAANSGHQLGPQYNPQKLRAIRRLSIHRVFHLLERSYCQSQEIEELFKQVASAFEVVIVSLNWDIVAERHLININLNYDYGLDIEMLELDPPSQNQDRTRRKVPLYKLHGSANWVYCDSCRKLYYGEGKIAFHQKAYLEPNDFKELESSDDIVQKIRESASHRDCSCCGNPTAGRIATFSYRKSLSISQFQTIWGKAHSALRDAEKWLFIGYSMPDADFEFRHLLKSAELGRRANSQCLATVILENDCAAEDRYRSFFGLQERTIWQCGLSSWVRQCLSSWVL